MKCIQRNINQQVETNGSSGYPRQSEESHYTELPAAQTGDNRQATTFYPTFGKSIRIGNVRDEASLRELIVLVNLESMNAELIKLGLSRADRAIRLNKMAIEQLRVLNESDERKLLNG